MSTLEAEFPDYIQLGKPFIIHTSEDEVQVYADDVFQGLTDEAGDIVVLLEKDIRIFYHPGFRTELFIVKGFNNKERRQFISPDVHKLFAYPFTQAGCNVGYCMLFLSDEEYAEVNHNLNPDGSSPTVIPPPITSLNPQYGNRNLMKRWGEILPLSGFHDFITLYKSGCYGGSQVSIRVSPNALMDVVYNRGNCHINHKRSGFGIIWHEWGHDAGKLWHDAIYSVLPDHGGIYDAKGNAAFPCIMSKNQWWFCPKCRLRLKGYVDPNTHCWATREEELDIRDHHLYGYERDRLESMGEYMCGQMHQPQQEAGSVPKP